MKINSNRLYAGLALAVSMQFGFVGTSGAASCLVSDVTIGGASATSCGWGSTNNDFTLDPPGTWAVNDDSAGGHTDWSFYEREEGVLGGSNAHDGNTSAINLVSSTIGDTATSGTMSLNVFNPTLITLKDGVDTLYHWYYFEDISYDGSNLSGTWDASVIFGGAAVSTVNAYSVVPVPAAVWLFGSGLLGLIGLARHKRS